MSFVRGRSTLLALLGAAFLALVAGCGLDQPAKYPQVSSIPAGEQIVLYATPADDPERSGFYVLDPASEALSRWQLQGNRGDTEGALYCPTTYTMHDQHRWEMARREFVSSGSFGCSTGLFHVSADGAVTEVPFPDLPKGVRMAHQPISSPSGQLLAVIGSVSGPADTTTQQIYVAGEDRSWTSYAEELGLEEIVAIRWSPDSRTIAFTGGFGSAQPFYSRIFHLDLERGEVRALSENEFLIGDAPTFTPQGDLLFAARTTDGQEALYLAKPGADAAAIMEQPVLPARTMEFRSRTFSPDGRFAAFRGRRDQSSDHSTIYIVDLVTGERRDLLSVAVSDERTGEIPPGAPWLEPLAWAPDGESLLVLSDRAGTCTMQVISGHFSCSQQLYLLPATGGALERLGSTDYKGVRAVAWLE